jgi:hypothetical protein
MLTWLGPCPPIASACTAEHLWVRQRSAGATFVANARLLAFFMCNYFRVVLIPACTRRLHLDCNHGWSRCTLACRGACVYTAALFTHLT